MTPHIPPAPACGSKRKREKIAGACTSCRQSKVRCEEARPCTRCISHGWHNSCVSWPHIKPRRRKQYDAERVDLQPATATVPPPPPLPPAVAAQSLFGGPSAPPFSLGWLGAQFTPSEVWPASKSAALSVEVVIEGSCAGIDAADGDSCVPPTGDALCEAGSELSDAENDDFWQSVEHLKAIPIAFDGLL